jgi:hypothetical protein
MDSIVIHCEPNVGWQGPFAVKMQAGLKALGINAPITSNRQREADVGILLGTTFWRGIEASGRYLLVDRASFGDPEFVSLVWDGHGRRGNHCVPENAGDRWSDISDQVTIHPWNGAGSRVVLCGQTETYSPYYVSVHDWYAHVTATHFRKHPVGENPTGLPLATDWSDAGRVVTLNSSVAVESVFSGIPTVTMDEGAMAWDVTSHDPEVSVTPNRDEWLQWLAWTQWHHDEIEAGLPIGHLFEDL